MTAMQSVLDQLRQTLPAPIRGTIIGTEGATASVAGLPAPVGAIVRIERHCGTAIRGEVIGFRDDLTLVSPMGNLGGVRRGSRVDVVASARWLRVGAQLLGRVIDPSGNVIDGGPTPFLFERMRTDNSAPKPKDRPRIDEPFSTGIRAIDAMLTCGNGQRLGVFSGSGVGKSVALGMIARQSSADVNVIALIGERGREVNEVVDQVIDRDGLAKTCIVVATGDSPAVQRVQAAYTAMAVAEFFRDRGQNVLFLMDSLTRLVMAHREISLSAGEPPGSRGYPASVFARLPVLLERAGRGACGSITGIFSVLVEADDMHEPVSDAVRGMLDGHVWLSRELAAQGHYPAVDVLQSISRSMPSVVNDQHRDAAMLIRRLLAAYEEHKDLVSVGAYRPGGNRDVDLALDYRQAIHRLLRQTVDEPSSVHSSRQALIELAEEIRQTDDPKLKLPPTQ